MSYRVRISVVCDSCKGETPALQSSIRDTPAVAPALRNSLSRSWTCHRSRKKNGGMLDLCPECTKNIPREKWRDV